MTVSTRLPRAAVCAAALFVFGVAASAAGFERTWPTRACVIQEPCDAQYCAASPAPTAHAAGCRAQAAARGFAYRAAPGDAAAPVCEFEIKIPATARCADNPPLADARRSR